MTPDQFAYWLQGFAELNPTPPSAEQWQAIRDHLGVVFDKRTPVLGKPIELEPAIPIAPDGDREPLDIIVRRLRQTQKLRDCEPTRVRFC